MESKSKNSKNVKNSKKSYSICEYIDGGSNLNHSRFQKDLKQVIQFAVEEQGVTQMMFFTNRINEIHKNLNFCLTYPNCLFTTIGVHPHHTRKLNIKSTINEIQNLVRTKSSMIKAIGPVGLDYTVVREPQSQKDQMKAFEAQVKLACELKFPLIVTEREAHYDVVNVLKKYSDRLPRTLFHAFKGNASQLAELLELNCYIGITGYVTTTHGAALRDVIHQIPLTHIICESNAPFMIPYATGDLLMKSRRNEPSTLPRIVAVAHEYYNLGKKQQDGDFVCLTTRQFSDEVRKNTRAFYSIV